VDSETLAAPPDLEKDNENGVGTGWKILTEKPTKNDAWIQKVNTLESMKTDSVPTGNHQ